MVSCPDPGLARGLLPSLHFRLSGNHDRLGVPLILKLPRVWKILEWRFLFTKHLKDARSMNILSIMEKAII
jgi:hypothetical protein